jgi:EpsI family protein
MNGIRSILKRHAIGIAAVILAAQTAFYYTGSAKDTIPTVFPWSTFPNQIGSWRSSGDLLLGHDVLLALQPDDYLARNYVSSSDPHAISLFIGYFNTRRDGRAPHSPQWCLPGAGWESLSSKIISIPVSNGLSPWPANEYLIAKNGEKQLVLYWYHQGARVVANEVVSQFFSLPDLILHGRTDIALVRIMVPVDGNDLTAAKASGVRFAQEAYPLIRQHIN